MTAHEEQDERIILLSSLPAILRHVRGGCHLVPLQGRFGLPPPAGHLAAHMIRHAPRGHLNQPGARIVGESFPRPLDGRRHQRFLDRVLDGGEIAKTADDGAQHLRRELV